MLANLGSFFLIISILSNLIIAIYPPAINYNLINFTTNRALNFYKALLWLANSSIIFCYLILLTLFIKNDLRVVSVLMNSSSLMELKYRIAASWSNHETSLLFWMFISGSCNLIFNYQSNYNEKITNAFNHFIQSGFLICIFWTANPFRIIQTIPMEGLGMNPSLQDIGIMIHPPLLFISYTIFQVIFCANLAKLFTSNLDKKILLNWSRYGWAILTMAVCLGGWWAYRELGWGGYWFFDPVENISLIIWLFAISYHHSLLQKEMEFTKIIFGLLPFIFALIGTFFVRSGLLTSVHSFAESKSSSILFIFSLFISLFSLAALTFNGHKVLHNKDQKSSLKYYIMQSGNIVWSFAAAILIISLVIPLLSSYFYQSEIELKPSFFINTIIPSMLIASILSGIIYFNRKLLKLLLIVTLNLIIAIGSFIFLKSTLLQTMAYFTGSIIISGSIIRAIEKIKEGTLKTSSISMLLGHVAAGIFIIAVCINNQYGFNKNLILNALEEAQLNPQNKILLSEIKYTNGPNYLRQIAHIRIFEGSNEITTLKPELRFYPIENSLSSEVDIYSFIKADWYAVINNIDGNQISLRIFYHPAIFWIWFSVFIAASAILLRSLKH